MANPSQIGPYAVVRVLGRGGMGTVYEVRDPHLSRSLALKLISSRQASPTAVERFWREAEALAKVHHLGVVRIHEMGQVPEGPYIVQELIEGESLDEVCQRRPPVSPRESARIVAELAEALAAIHTKGILHRDIKPANVLLRPDGIPVLLDFGLAREVAAESLTKTGAMLGTPAYMSPEQARGEKGPGLDERTDVYGLGTILYELLSGHAPFVGSTPLELMGQLLYDDPPWPRTERKGIPAPLDAICRMSLAKDLEERYPSAQAFKADLEAYLAGKPTRASRAMRSARRRTLLAGVGVCLLLAAGAGWVATRQGEAPTSAGTRADSSPLVSDSMAAAPAQLLWDLQKGERFPLRFRYEERDTASRLFIDLQLDAYVVDVEDPLATIECTFRRALGSVGTLAIMAAGQPYDSAQDDPEHFMAGLGQTIGQSFTFRLDRATGHVPELSGMAPIIARMLPATRRSPMGITVQWLKNQIGQTFSDEHLQQVFDRVLGVRAERMPWRLQPGRRGETGARFFLSRSVEPVAIEPAYRTMVFKPGHRYRLEGKAEFEGERLRSSRFVQELVGRQVRGELRPVPADSASRLEAILEAGAE